LDFFSILLLSSLADLPFLEDDDEDLPRDLLFLISTGFISVEIEA
jgi:hypothetical protein